MDRYWRELDDTVKRLARTDIAFRSLLSGPPVETRRAHRIVRVFSKYFLYPLLAGFPGSSDLFHLLDHSHASLLRFLPSRASKVATVHDLIPLRDSQGLTRCQLERFRSGVSELRRADIILADSDFSAQDVRSFLGASCPPVRRLFMGVNSRLYATDSGKLPTELRQLLDVPVILCVGSNAARKNLDILPEVLRMTLQSIGPLCLVRVGPPLPAPIQQRLRALGDRLQIVQLPNLAELDLIATYQRASLLFFPSLLEGFGFPVLEAMAAGTPVVASDASSIPEVGGDSALYFNPNNPEQAANCICTMLNDRVIRENLVKNGRDRARKFDWNIHLEELCTIYQSVFTNKLT